MENLRISLIQTDLHWEEPAANRAMFEEKIWNIANPGDLILLPEMFTTGFSMNPAPLAEPSGSTTYQWMRQMAAQTGAVVAGSYIVKAQGAYFNRFHAVYPDGKVVTYDKKHLFVLAGEGENYQAGQSRNIFQVKGWRILPLICYDLRFPVWARSVRQAQQLYEYDLVVYVANWPEPRIHAWDTLLAARAIENQAYAAGVNRLGVDGVGARYVGHSGIYDYLGRCMAHSKEDVVLQTELNAADLLAFRERFPFQADADRFTIH